MIFMSLSSCIFSAKVTQSASLNATQQ
jgi:hypothetical protein